MKRAYLLILPLLEILGLDQALENLGLAPAFAAEVGVPFLLLAGLAIYCLEEETAPLRRRATVCDASFHLLAVLGWCLSLNKPFLVLALTPIVLVSGLFPLLRESRWCGELSFALMLLAAGPLLTRGLWAPLALAAGKTALLALRGWDGSVLSRWCGGHFVIDRGGFTAALTEGCAGLKGMLLFIFLFTTLRVLGALTCSRARFFALCAAGVALMAGLNVARIALFVSLGSYLSATITDPARAQSVVHGLHANLGWALYAVALAFFLPWLVRQQTTVAV